jgi:hypothetical protein
VAWPVLADVKTPASHPDSQPADNKSPIAATSRDNSQSETAGPPAAAPALDAAKADALKADASKAAAEVPLPRARVEARTPHHASMDEICGMLATAARRQELPIPFFIRLIWQESRFDPHAVSPVGAQGLAQFMPQVAYSMGLDDPFDPIQALKASARLLRDLLGKFDNNLGLAAAAYNAGPKRISDWLDRRGQLPQETRDYVFHITGHPAERWRKTTRGRLALEVPERAPCHEVAESGAMQVMALVPAPVPPKKTAAHKTKTARHSAGKSAHPVRTADHKSRGKTSKTASRTVVLHHGKTLVLKAHKVVTTHSPAHATKHSTMKLASAGRKG